MKKMISVILTAAMVFCLCISAFAADSATFAVNVVSEDDSKATVSIDYNGGANFNCLDFEVKLSSNVSVSKCENGAGLNNFKIYVNDLGTGDAVISSFNKDANPVMFTFASTVGFKATNGKDLLVLTLKKSSSAKLTEDNVKLTVTNCAVSESIGDTTEIDAQVIQIGNKNAVTTSAAPAQAGTTVANTSSALATTEATTASESDSASQSSAQNDDEVTAPISEQETAEAQNSTTNKKKIIIVAALAVIMLAVIVAAVVYIAHKAKKEDVE